MKTLLASATCAMLLLAGSASAISITITEYTGKASYDAIAGGFGTTFVEDFESYTEGNVGPDFATSVGTFNTLGGVGSGGTVTDPVSKGNFAGNDGSKLAVRDGNVHGRTSTTNEIFGTRPGDTFLDSNDTWGIEWLVNVGRAFNEILFVMTDATDTGNRLWVTADDGAVSQTVDLPAYSFGNGSKRLVHVNFGDYVTDAKILLDHRGRTNDGVAIDDISVAVVPLPAPALMLLAGLGGLAALRRRRPAA